MVNTFLKENSPLEDASLTQLGLSFTVLHCVVFNIIRIGISQIHDMHCRAFMNKGKIPYLGICMAACGEGEHKVLA
jgi:hypothetical protein